MFSLIKKLLPKKLKNDIKNYLRFLLETDANKSYSQEGEDMILRRLFERKQTGFYVDVGAHHPARFSNTYYFYKRGWHGINIDAMPGSMHLFEKYRPRDTNIEVPISSNGDLLTYYIFNEPALNSFDKNLSIERDSSSSEYKIQKTIELKSRTLADILEDHLPVGQSIDFLTIDVEGLDFDVLQSNDWQRYVPEVICVEVLSGSLKDLGSNQITEYLRMKGYEIYAKTVYTVFYKLQNNLTST